MRTSMDDWQLIQAYAKDRSEAAFAELVRLHLDWVFSMALRHVGDPHLAENVVQSVYVLLARKARDLSPGTQVAGLALSHDPPRGGPRPARRTGTATPTRNL